LVEISEGDPFGTRARLEVNKLKEEVILQGMVRRAVNHRNLESIIVSSGFLQGREREGASIDVGELHRLLVPKDENSATSADGGSLGKTLEARTADRGGDELINQCQFGLL
jgi:hypothetical protein